MIEPGSSVGKDVENNGGDASETDGTWTNFLVNLMPNKCRNSSLVKMAEPEDRCSRIVDPSGDFEPGDLRENPDSKQELFTVHRLNSNNIESRFRKSWGNFINIFDEQGKQKNFISHKQLSNYLLLENFSDNSTSMIFYATLFTGNYPKPLYNGSGTSWRMRYNVFVSGLSNEQQPKLDDMYDLEENILHLGELHLYFHVERGSHEPLYQNLCFFYDRSLVKLATTSEILSHELKACAGLLKRELSFPMFIEQFYFPIDKSRFKAVDNMVDYFDLRQQDLKAAIRIANEKMPFQFLHRPMALLEQGATIIATTTATGNKSEK